MKFTSTAIILSGGLSKRMGENKSLLKLNEKTIIEHSVELMKSLFSNVILITNTPKEYEFLNIPIFEDIYKNKGPLAGIHSGLFHSKTEDNFVISCDTPLMSSSVVKYIVNYKTQKLITLCKADGYIQQLVGVYSKSLVPIIETIFDNGERHSVYSLLDRVEGEIIEIGKMDFYKKDTFLNMNNKEDYQYIVSKLNFAERGKME